MATMYEDDLLAQRARAFPMSHGLVPHPQPFSFGFSVHPAHDPMAMTVNPTQQFGAYPHLSTRDHRRGLSGSHTDGIDKNIKINIENRDLWQKFHSIGTEMIITKNGRAYCRPDWIYTTNRFKTDHVHVIAGGKPGRSGKPTLSDQLRTTVIHNRTNNVMSPPKVEPTTIHVCQLQYIQSLQPEQTTGEAA